MNIYIQRKKKKSVDIYKSTADHNIKIKLQKKKKIQPHYEACSIKEVLRWNFTFVIMGSMKQMTPCNGLYLYSF